MGEGVESEEVRDRMKKMMRDVEKWGDIFTYFK